MLKFIPWVIVCTILSIIFDEAFIKNLCFGNNPKLLELYDENFQHIVVFSKIGNIEKQEAV